MSDELYMVKARSSIAPPEAGFLDYIATNEDFQKFAREVIDLSAENPLNPAFSRYVRQFKRIKLHGETLVEDRAIQGIEKVVDTKVGKVNIGYTRVRENRIYVSAEGQFYRGIRAFFGDICLVNAMDFTPLDKSEGDGNIEILVWNKRTSTKGIRFIHNKIQSILYVVDLEFESEESMLRDMENPSDLNLSLIFEPIIRDMSK